MDVLHVSTETGRQFRDTPTFDNNVRQTLSELSMQDMRSGIAKVSGRLPGFHINTPMGGKRPPLGAMVISNKFSRGTQMIDYLTRASTTLFGAPVFVGPYAADGPTTRRMPDFLREWLDAQFGVVYGSDCSIAAIHHTHSI
jgi:hypothetical protein